MKAPECLPNDSNKAGARASEAVTTENGFQVLAIHTRFSAVCWIAIDPAKLDEETGLPAIVRQEETFEAVIASL